MIILKEGNFPHPCSPRCDMLVPWKALNGRHITNTQCAMGTEKKRCRLEAEEMREITEKAFHGYGMPLETVTPFKYLGRIMMASDDDWTSVVDNLRKAWKSWARMESILGREGDIPRV